MFTMENNYTLVEADDIHRFQRSSLEPSAQYVNICKGFVGKKTWHQIKSIVCQPSTLDGADTDAAAVLVRFMENKDLICVMCDTPAPKEIENTNYVRFKKLSQPPTRWMCDACLADKYRDQ
jgi:hypothetical protein